jgi:signal transduction histidine kinase
LYDAGGNVIATTLGFEDNQPLSPEQVQESQEQVFIRALQESPERYQVVAATAGQEVALRQVVILNQDYQLAFGEWRLRDQSFGLFSVALPSNFIVSAAAVSRNLLSGVFTIATLAVITIGYLISQRIVTPINRLAEVSESVAQGDLDRRSDINRSDEIGTLARSFDTMTLALVERNRQLVEQASKQEAIVQSIADGLIVLDTNNQIVASNPSGKALIEQVFEGGVVQSTNSQLENETHLAELFTTDTVDQIARRYQVGSFVYSALAAPFTTPDGKRLGRVIVLRDTTREAEAEHLKDGFLASVSHELRTPLTAIKGYNELLLMTGAQDFNDTQRRFLEIIRENTEALISHINKLIDISGMQQMQTIHLNRELVSFSMLVTDMTATWREKMTEKQLALEADIEESILVEGDAARLGWAIDNLFSNAYCYTHPGGSVAVRLQRQNGEVCLDIQDTGIGVSPVDQPFLFTRFFRA